jgi:cytochrome c oxidase subunit 2
MDGQEHVKRDLQIAAVAWVILTIVTVIVVAVAYSPFPTQGAEEAEFIDGAYELMTYMAAPVFAFVIVTLGYSVWRFRTKGEPTEDGPHILGTGKVPLAWFIITSALAAAVMIHPGLTGIAELRHDRTQDMVIQATGVQWQWLINYTDHDVIISGRQEAMVLPEHTRIRFDITAGVVLHAFWVPAFRQKIDAVPGQITQMWITTLEPSEDDDIAYRLQCAELCGLEHSAMSMPVKVVTQEEFDSWVLEQNASARAR